MVTGYWKSEWFVITLTVPFVFLLMELMRFDKLPINYW